MNGLIQLSIGAALAYGNFKTYERSAELFIKQTKEQIERKRTQMILDEQENGVIVVPIQDDEENKGFQF